MNIQIYVSDTFSKHYLPFMLYRNILKDVCEKNITPNVSEIYDLSEINNVESNILILNLYALTNEQVSNDSTKQIFTFLQNLKTKVVLINTEFYTAFNVNKIMENINQAKLNWYILEYNILNYNYFKSTYPNLLLHFLPPIYNEYLETYYKSKLINNIPWSEKTDVLFFGSINQRRIEVLNKISTKYKVKVIQGLSGEKENSFICNEINNAKIVLNVSVNGNNIVFDYYRNSFLLANKVLLISERPKILDTTIQQNLIDIENNFVLADYDNFYEVVDNYLSNYNQSQIEEIINKQYNHFKSYNMKDNIIDFFNNKLNFYKQLPLFKVFMSNDVIEPLNKVLMSGFITQGGQVDKFEEKLCEYFNNKYVLTLNSATSGLTLALRLLMNEDKEDNWTGFNIEEDYVLSPALTCFATNASILANNCKIKWIDVDKNTANVSIEDIKNKLNKNTKIVYVVHWGGYPVELDELKVLQEEHLQKYGYKFKIIEDCAHAFGATYNQKMLGSHGNICVFSLQAIKHLTTGDGGLIILPNEKLYERTKLLRWFGIDRNKRNYNRKDFRLENDIEEWGYKFHMNDINATIGLYNLPHINKLLEKNRNNYMYLYNNLKNINGIRLFELKENREFSAWLFTMAIERKNEFVDKMKEYGISTSQVHNRNDLNTCVSEFKCDLPNITELEKELICIPVGWWLEIADLDYMIEKIKIFYNNLYNEFILSMITKTGRLFYENTDKNILYINNNVISYDEMVLPIINTLKTNYDVYFLWGYKTIEDLKNLMKKCTKETIIFFTNDYNEDNIDIPSNVFLYRTGMYKSKRKNNEFALSALFASEIKYTLKKCLNAVERTDKPKISFIGGVNTYVKRLEWLEYLKNSNLLECNFVYKNDFRSGPITDFIDNTQLSEFIFCPRGTGNFSIRFYEGLQYGRIPVIVNTDMGLPFEDFINWDEYIVSADTIEELPEKIYNFWKNNNIVEIQNKCNKLYEEYFSFENIGKYILKELENKNKKNIYYSQLGEDLYLHKTFINKNTKDGIFVEIGGLDGLTHSNSKFFEDTLKFNGVLIEPTKNFNEMCINRPNCKNFNYAVNYKEENIKFMGSDGCAGIVENIPQLLKDKFHKNSFVYDVSGMPMSKIMDMANIKYIDVFFIDVEGSEYLILDTMDWNIEIYIIVIEAHNLNPEKDEYCRNILKSKGFRLHDRLIINEIWINDNYSRKDRLYDEKINKIKEINNIYEYGKFPYIEQIYINDIKTTINKQ